MPTVLFTRENASEYARRATVVREANRIANRERAKLLPRTIAKPDDGVREELELVNEQIANAREVLNEEDYDYCVHCKRAGVQPQHRAQLMKALDTFLDRKRILLGRPNPGTLKPTAPKQSRQPMVVEPVELPSSTQAAPDSQLNA